MCNADMVGFYNFQVCVQAPDQARQGLGSGAPQERAPDEEGMQNDSGAQVRLRVSRSVCVRCRTV